MSSIDLAEVREWARQGGVIAKSYFNGGTERRKPDRSWVTQADVEIEQFLTERITARYPDHGIMGEERGIHNVDREFVWALDPLDGTGAFVAGLPIWGVSIGILRAGVPYAGVVYLPMMDECYWADANGDAFWDGHSMHVKQTEQVESNDWIAVPSKTHRDYDLSFPGKARSLGSVAAHFCYVARGSAVGALLGRPYLWDIAAGVAILGAAGGLTVGLSGAPITLDTMLHGEHSPEPIVLATPPLLPQLLASVKLRPRG